jgi:hypothetical protein
MLIQISDLEKYCQEPKGERNEEKDLDVLAFVTFIGDDARAICVL